MRPVCGAGCQRVRDLPTPGAGDVLNWVRRRFECGGCSGTQYGFGEAMAEREGARRRGRACLVLRVDETSLCRGHRM